MSEMHVKKKHCRILSTPRFDVFHDTFYTRQGKRRDYYYVSKPNSVVVVAFKANKILFLKVKRYLSKTTRYELPGGRMEKGESPINAAKRELKEETGLKSTRWKTLGNVYPLPSVTMEKAHIFSTLVADGDRVNLNNHAKEEGIVGYEFLDHEKILYAISNNLVGNTIDAFATLLFVIRTWDGFGGKVS